MTPANHIDRFILAACAALVVMLVNAGSSAADVDPPAATPEATSGAAAPSTEPSSLMAKILERSTIKQTLDLEYAPRPALAQLTRSEGKTTWSLHAGAQLDLAFGPLREHAKIGPTFEIHRETAAGEEQNFLRAGIGVESAIGWTSASGLPVFAAVGYMRDGVKDTSGVTAKAKLSIIVPGHESPWHDLYRPNIYTTFPNLHVTYTPFIGFEYENIMDAMTEGDEGNIGRIHAQLTLRMYPYPEPDDLDGRLELVVDGSWRTDIFGSLQGGDRHHPFVSSSLNLYLLKEDDHAIGIGIDHVWGENPDEKFEKQALVRFGVKGML